MLTRLTGSILASVMTVGLAATGPARAQDGTPASLPDAGASASPEVVIDRMRPTIVTTDAVAASGGTGLRNRAGGAIEIAGLPNPANMKRAFIYWYIIVDGSAPAGADRITVQRVGPDTSQAFTVTGALIGEGVSPCWGGGPGQVYRAALPRARLVNGNGTYLVSVPPGVPGSTNGENPWSSSPLPLYNGASIVAIAEGSGNVMIYDGAPLSGMMFSDRLVSRFVIPGRFDTAGQKILHLINSDGQTGGANFSDAQGTATERTRLNGTNISGPLSAGRDGDWNGAAGGRVSQLWDNAIRNITGALAGRRVARIADVAGSDCLVPVARVIDTQ